MASAWKLHRLVKLDGITLSLKIRCKLLYPILKPLQMIKLILLSQEFISPNHHQNTRIENSNHIIMFISAMSSNA